MRAAVFALTDGGAALAARLCAALDGEAQLYLPERLNGSTPTAGHTAYFAHLSAAITTAFSRYDALVCVMATGIVVRTLAPCVRSKLYDPAVIVFDEQGRHGISLLSGHVGGANDLTRTLCAAVGADPVITTATDVTGVLAPDAVATRLALRPVPKSAIQVLNTALMAGEEVHYDIDSDLPQAAFYEAQLREQALGARPFRGEVPPADGASRRVVIVGAEHAPATAGERWLYAVPPRPIPGRG